MDKLTVTIVYNVKQYNIPKKIYNVDATESMRSFKNRLLLDLKSSGIDLTPEEAINFGFARIDHAGRYVHFTSDHTKASILASSDGIIQQYVVLFTTRSRFDFSQRLNIKDITHMNKLTYRAKFIKHIEKENIEKVIKYLSKGLDPNFFFAKYNICPLFVWASVSLPLLDAMFGVLLNGGAHLDFRNFNGLCITHYAISMEKYPVLKLLKERGMSFDDWDKAGVPAMFYALDKDMHTRCLEYILELDPTINPRDSSGNNSLHYCCKKGLANHLTVLLRHMTMNLSPDQYYDILTWLNVSGNTPIHSCILQNQKSCLEIMLNCKVPLNITNSSGDTPHELAIRTHDMTIINILDAAKNCGSVQEKRYIDEVDYNVSLEICKKADKKIDSSFSAVDSNDQQHSSPVLKVASNYTARCGDELDISHGTNVRVHLVLRSGVAFGYKMTHTGAVYGWFPSECVNLKSDRKIRSFQKEFCTLSRLALVVPCLKSCACPLVPILLFVNMAPNSQILGLEIGCRKAISSFKKTQDSLTVSASPFYARHVISDSPADKAGIRVGDQILFILSNEITTFPMTVVSDLVKTLCNSKVPQNFPKNTIRQISFVVMRKNETTAPFGANFFEEHNFSALPSTKNSNTSSSETDIVSSVGLTQSLVTSSESTGKSTTCTRPERPLPYVINIRNKNNAENIQDSSSDESFPSPPAELLCDNQK